MNTQDNKLKSIDEFIEDETGGYSVRMPSYLHEAYIKAAKDFAAQLQLNKQVGAVYSKDDLKDMLLRYGCLILDGKLKTPFDYERAKDEIIDSMLQSTPTISFSEDGWIDVKDRLPDESGEVLIVSNSNTIYVAHYKMISKVFTVYGVASVEIMDIKTTHWQKLPKPPQK